MRMGKVCPKDIAITKALCRNAECFFCGIFAGRAEILKNPLEKLLAT